eukprot:jgi/Botrbrau1/186/Bobra.0022s0166.1
MTGNGVEASDLAEGSDHSSNGVGPYSEDIMEDVPVRRSIADSEDFDPEDLFPGWEFRVSDKYDEDMPYPFQKGAQPASHRAQGEKKKSNDQRQAAEEGEGGNVEEERKALTRAWALSSIPEGEMETAQINQDTLPPYDTHHLPDGSANPLTKQVGLHVQEGPKKGGPDDREEYYGHADENIADIVAADAASLGMSGSEGGQGGWWATTKNTTRTLVGGAVGGVVNWWASWNQDTGDDPREAKKKKEEERRERDRREGRQPLEDVLVPPDLPIEAIAEEVKDAWRLKEVHVESLMKKAVEKSERPWLMFLGASTIVCIIMLALVFWRLESLL